MSQTTNDSLPRTLPPTNITEDAAKLRDALEAHQHVVDRVLAREMRRLPRCVDPRDLRAAGMAALLAAIRHSVHSSEEMFVAYAQIRIRGAIMDELRRIDWSPRRRKQEPGAAARGEATSAPLRIVGIGELDDREGQLRQPTTFDSPLDEVIRRRDSADLRTAVRSLPAREAEVVRLRYFEEMPSKAIAAVLRVSEARVSQINASATRKLRALLADRTDDSAVAA